MPERGGGPGAGAPPKRGDEHGTPTQRSASRSFYALVAIAAALIGTQHCDPSHPFNRNAPPVEEAIALLDASDGSSAAATLLEKYLQTGACSGGNIGTPDKLKERPQATFDLGLALFQVAESFGERFGDELTDGGSPNPERTANADCASRVVEAIAQGREGSLSQIAHARYLQGNIHFLAGRYREAVDAYDKSLTAAPGAEDAGAPSGRDAAWNRAIALKRMEDEQHDAGSDGSPSPDASSDAGQPKPDSGNDGGQPSPDAGEPKPDAGSGQDNQPDAAGQEDASPPPAPEPPDGSAPKPSPAQDDRILDQLENAPTLQQEAARKQANKHRRRPSLDK